jgi:hypothetical protein
MSTPVRPAICPSRLARASKAKVFEIYPWNSHRSTNGGQRRLPGFRFQVVSCQLSVVSCQLSVVSCQLSAGSGQLAPGSWHQAVGSGQWAGPPFEFNGPRNSEPHPLNHNTVQCSVNNFGIEGCVAVSLGGWNPIVNIATARLHGRSIVADSLAEGQSHRSLGQRPRKVDRPITIGWLKANLTKANGRDWRDSTNCCKIGPFEATQWVEVGLQPTKGRRFGNSRFPRVCCLAHLGRCPRLR